jgi:NADH-quinone oxidoreductase subunit L
MTVPLILLALLSIVGGFVGIPASLGGGNALEHWLDPVFEGAREKMALVPHDGGSIEYLLMGTSVLVAVGGILFARALYLHRKEIADRIKAQQPPWYKILLNKYYIDELYDAVVVTPTVKGSERLLWNIIDVGIIDWLVNATGRAVAGISRVARMVQTGAAQGYVLVFLLGVVTILGWLVVK